MDLGTLAKLGEFIGGIAVIVSLLYLAAQIRQNTKVARANAHQATFETYASLLTSMKSDPSWMAILRKAVTEWDDLSKNEQALVHVHMSAHLMHCENAFTLKSQGVLDPDFYQALEDFNVSMLICPGLSRWYAMQERVLPPRFSERIRSRLSDPSTLPPAMHEVFPFYAPD